MNRTIGSGTSSAALHSQRDLLLRIIRFSLQLVTRTICSGGPGTAKILEKETTHPSLLTKFSPTILAKVHPSSTESRRFEGGHGVLFCHILLARIGGWVLVLKVVLRMSWQVQLSQCKYVNV